MFSAQLINEPFADPGVYVKLKYRDEAILFDLGDLHHFPSRRILKISTIFISHTHMDHFIGFDHVLRICLGRDRHIALYGPPGFIRNVENRIFSYTWNLVENYTNDFLLTVHEVHTTHIMAKRYRCQDAFCGEMIEESGPFNGVLLDRDDFIVRTAFLDHKIPSLAFSLEEKSHINILKNALGELGLPQGKWLAGLKEKIHRGEPDDTPVEVAWKGGRPSPARTTFSLGELKEKIVKITAGQKISYIADAVGSEENREKIAALARDSDIMFIEATFLHKDAARASNKFHLTAKQAGELAREAGAKRMVIFHFSPKYRGKEHLLNEEALAAFRGFS